MSKTRQLSRLSLEIGSVYRHVSIISGYRWLVLPRIVARTRCSSRRSFVDSLTTSVNDAEHRQKFNATRSLKSPNDRWWWLMDITYSLTSFLFVCVWLLSVPIRSDFLISMNNWLVFLSCSTRTTEQNLRKEYRRVTGKRRRRRTWWLTNHGCFSSLFRFDDVRRILFNNAWGQMEIVEVIKNYLFRMIFLLQEFLFFSFVFFIYWNQRSLLLLATWHSYFTHTLALCFYSCRFVSLWNKFKQRHRFSMQHIARTNLSSPFAQPILNVIGSSGNTTGSIYSK